VVIASLFDQFFERHRDLERVGQHHFVLQEGFCPVLIRGGIEVELPRVDDVAVGGDTDYQIGRYPGGGTTTSGRRNVYFGTCQRTTSVSICTREHGSFGRAVSNVFARRRATCWCRGVGDSHTIT
jgi:hypothetical protein